MGGRAHPHAAQRAQWCIANHYTINIEIKPSPGTEAATGKAVAKLVRKIWPAHLPLPLLSSFQPAALVAAYETAPELPRGLLLDKLPDDCIKLAQKLRCQALILEHTLWSRKLVKAAHEKGMAALSYTVNDEDSAERLIKIGTDGIITDRVDFFSPVGNTL